MLKTDKINKHSKIIVNQQNRIIALKNQVIYYKEVTETVREPFVILDKNLRVVTANRSFYTKFKVLRKNTEGKRIYELGDSEWDTPELRELLEHILPKRRVLNNYEFTHDFPVIGTKTMNLNARQVDSKQLILLAMEDITSLRKHEADSDELTANLITQRDRLKALKDIKDEFISLASHQLRTPATVVKQYIGMLKDNYAGKMSKGQHAMLDVAYESNERQLEIIDDLLRVARIDEGKIHLKKSNCDMVAQVKIVMENQAILFKNRGQHIVLHEPDRKIIAYIDRKLMLMVIDNILDNAGKYSPRGQEVSIDITQDKKFTSVAIKDTGVGIKKIDLKNLFKKFSRIDNSFSEKVKGTGLGLYWAQKILGLHGGAIIVSSKLNKGTTFTIMVPVEAVAK